MVLPVAGSWKWRPALTTNIHKMQTLGMSEAPALKQPMDTSACTRFRTQWEEEVCLLSTR